MSNCCETLANALRCRRAQHQNDLIIHSTPSSTLNKNESPRGKPADNDGKIGITNIDYPAQTVHMKRFDDPNGSADVSVSSQNSEIELKKGGNSEVETAGDENPFMSFISSISERINELTDDARHTPPDNGREDDEEEAKESEIVGDEAETDKRISRSQSKDTRSTFQSFFAARESELGHEKFEKFRDDASIILEETISEEKIDIHIETTVQISPSVASSIDDGDSDTGRIVAPKSSLLVTTSHDNNSAINDQGDDTAAKEKKNKSKRKKSKSPTSVENIDQSILAKLSLEVPETTDAERKRFLIARKGDYKGTLEQLKAYVQWREECRIDDEDVEFEIGSRQVFGSFDNDDEGYSSCASSVGAQDRSDWAMAAAAAVAYYEKKGSARKIAESKELSFGEEDELQLPQLAHMVTAVRSETYLRDNKGNRILLLLPAQVNIDDVNEETYALAIGFYLDRKLDRESLEKIVVAIDLRAGQGWPNPPAKKVVPFVKCVVSLLERNFPERLAKSVLFPLPGAATMLWRVVKVFLDPNTAAKISVIGGSSGIHDTVSAKKFEKICDVEVKNRMEEIRRDCFISNLKRDKALI